MKPEDANTKNCKVVRVIYNDEEFSCAYLYIVNEGKNKLGVRWNINYGSKPENQWIGSPNIGVSPKWFYLPDDLIIPTLNSIAGLSSTNEDIRLEVIKAFTNKTIIKPE